MNLCCTFEVIIVKRSLALSLATAIVSSTFCGEAAAWADFNQQLSTRQLAARCSGEHVEYRVLDNGDLTNSVVIGKSVSEYSDACTSYILGALNAMLLVDDSGSLSADTVRCIPPYDADENDVARAFNAYVEIKSWQDSGRSALNTLSEAIAAKWC